MPRRVDRERSEAAAAQEQAAVERLLEVVSALRTIGSDHVVERALASTGVAPPEKAGEPTVDEVIASLAWVGSLQGAARRSGGRDLASLQVLQKVVRDWLLARARAEGAQAAGEASVFYERAAGDVRRLRPPSRRRDSWRRGNDDG
jgi:hypothetical protein